MSRELSNSEERARHAERILASAECLYTDAQVKSALGVMALDIDKRARLYGDTLVVVAIMNGGLVCCGQLLPSLSAAVELDYVHATRYRNNRPGPNVEWLHTPTIDLTGRRVLLVDDILDGGITLKAVADECRRRGARSVEAAVMVRKERSRAPAVEADYWALSVPDRYVFGWGMDCDGLLRNAPGIYALS